FTFQVDTETQRHRDNKTGVFSKVIAFTFKISFMFLLCVSVSAVAIALSVIPQPVVDQLHVLARDRLPAARAEPPSAGRRRLFARRDRLDADLDTAPLERAPESPESAPRVVARCHQHYRAQAALARVLAHEQRLDLRARNRFPQHRD